MIHIIVGIVWFLQIDPILQATLPEFGITGKA
jgi:hypothetical protein